MKFDNQREFGFAPDAFNLMGERGAAVVEAEKPAEKQPQEMDLERWKPESED